MSTYHVTVTRDSGMWAAVIDGLPPGVVGATDVEQFSDLDVEVRDLIAGLTDREPDGFELTWAYVVDGSDVTAQVTRYAAAEADYRAAARDREAARAQALDALTRAGLSQAAIGDVLGLSHQRVHQLTKAS